MKEIHLAATSVTVAYVTAEKVVEISNVFQAVCSLVVGVLTLVWWIRIWWKAVSEGGNLPKP